jgi:hypothetical protein
MYFDKEYDVFKQEEIFKATFLSDLILDKPGVRSKSQSLIQSLNEKVTSLSDKTFNIPILGSVREIKLPVYSKIGDEKNDKYLFKTSVAKLQQVITKFSEIEKL